MNCNEINGVVTSHLGTLNTSIAMDTEGPHSFTALSTLNFGCLGARALGSVCLSFGVVFGAISFPILSSGTLGGYPTSLLVSLSDGNKFGLDCTATLKFGTFGPNKVPKMYTPIATKGVLTGAMARLVHFRG